MTVRIGINGFGRMGRLATRVSWPWDDFEIVHINEIKGSARSAAHLLNFDSVHGRWQYQAESKENEISIDNKPIAFTQEKSLLDVSWQQSNVDIVLECSGKFKEVATLNALLDRGIKSIVLSTPVKNGPLNIVMGVNDDLYDPQQHKIITAASCTTNCIAPVIKVLHEHLTIKHGAMTTIHNITNSQSILDENHHDLRRARACGSSLIPTTTGSATAIGVIFPELAGKLNGLSVRVPLANASLTDGVFEVETPTSKEQVNALLKQASTTTLQGILGYEELPLVSVDYVNDTRSSIIDALSTMVVNETQVKVLAWYDNEIGYVNRMMEIVSKVANNLSLG
ncbi:MAG: ArsJ-associated glyceraldehyde-3-phosphate dehydrogenase [Gammaproteobacteria bacterium]